MIQDLQLLLICKNQAKYTTFYILYVFVVNKYHNSDTDFVILSWTIDAYSMNIAWIWRLKQCNFIKRHIWNKYNKNSNLILKHCVWSLVKIFSSVCLHSKCRTKYKFQITCLYFLIWHASPFRFEGRVVIENQR